jgi:ABC-type lipoprotein release transport system permease subunit
MIQSLRHYWRIHLAVGLGATIATAVLTGALLVGDSVRGSLRDLVLGRLGEIDLALVAGTPFREALAGELATRLAAAGFAAPSTAPGLMLRGSAVHAASSARAADVAVLGLDERTFALFPGAVRVDLTEHPGPFPSVALNEALAAELGAAVGDDVVLTFERPAEIPRETVVGRQDASETLASLRLSVTAVVPDDGFGGFGLAAQQSRNLNAFVDLSRLQRELFGRGEAAARANLLLAAFAAHDVAPAAQLSAALAGSLTLEDLGLTLAVGADRAVLESRSFVVSAPLAEAVSSWAAENGTGAQPVLTYLANSIRLGAREVPYSTVSSLDPPAAPGLGSFLLADGSPAPRLAEDEILLNAWAAEDLGAERGDEIELDYYVVGPRHELAVVTARFRLAGVVAMQDLAIDPELTPDFPGIEQADDISAWDPPFPVELARIRSEDEGYWDEYRASPKAFVSEATGRRLWSSRFGELTSVRLAPVAGASPSEMARSLERELPRRLDPEAAGFQFRPLRAEGLQAAAGSTDFSSLFLGLSLFLIASAALLCALLFGLGVERRAREVGLRRAIGYRLSSVRRSLLAEGSFVAALGTVAGLAGAVGYAALMLAGLRTWWLPAVGTSALTLHLRPLSLVIGAVASLLVVVATIAWTVRRLDRTAIPALLAGGAGESGGPRGRWAHRVARVFALAALVQVALALATGKGSSPAYAFGTGAALLVAGLAAFAHLVGGGRRRENAVGSAGIGRLGVRNTRRNRARSVLSVALVSSACFLIVVVAANRGGEAAEVTDPASGAGGFTLVAQTDVAIHGDLGAAPPSSDLGFEPADAALLSGVEILSFRLLPGEDVSCLNLFRPQRPRVLGVPRELIERNAFSFQSLAVKSDRPWTLLDHDLGPGVVPAFADVNSALWILHAGLGDELTIEDGEGREIRLRLVGLLAKGIFQSELLISERRFLELFPDRTGYAWFLADPPLDRVAEVSQLLERRLGRFGLDATPTAERLAAYQAVESTYMATFQTLGGLGLLLGTAGLGIVLVRNVLERRRELATLSAFGYRRQSIAWMVAAENSVLLASGIGIGAIAGLVAAAPRLISSGQGVPWLSLGGTLAMVFAVGSLAGWLAVRGSVGVPLLPALRAE